MTGLATTAAIGNNCFAGGNTNRICDRALGGQMPKLSGRKHSVGFQARFRAALIDMSDLSLLDGLCKLDPNSLDAQILGDLNLISK